MTEYLPFLILSLFVVMSPGIDTALITKTTIASGKKHGFHMALGISVGCLVHTLAAAFGLSAILMKSALAFEIVKYAGAVYLLYLGISSLGLIKKKQQKNNITEASEAEYTSRELVAQAATQQAPDQQTHYEHSHNHQSDRQQPKHQLPTETSNPFSAFKQGLFTNILNPKVAMFFLTFLPQFVNTSSGSGTATQLVMMGVIHSLLSITWFFVYVYFITYIRDWLLSPKVQKMMDKVTGMILIGFALKLALEKQR